MNLKRIKFFTAILIFICSGTSLSRGEIIDRIIAIVNDESITLNELKRDAAPLIFEVKSRYPLEEQKQRVKEVKEKVLAELVKEKLQLQKAKELGITVSEESISSAIEEQKKIYSISEEQFQESLKKDNITFFQYRQKIRDQITIITLMNHVVKPKIFFTSKELKDYYDSNIDYFRIQGTVHLQQILIKPDVEDKKFSLADLESKIYKIFNERKSYEGLADIADRLEKEGIPSRLTDMGFYRKDEMAPEFATAFSLNSGDFAIVKGASSYHILKVLEKVKDTIKPFSDAKDQIEEILYNKKRDKIYQDYLKELEENAYIEKKDID